MAVSQCQLGLDKLAIFEDEDRENVSRRRSDQGFHECEAFGSWSLEEEANDAWDNCKKNKDTDNHKNFIPVSEITQDNLPIQQREGGVLLRLILALAELTVRLRVHHVTGNRPDGYTFSGYRNQDRKHLGTGWVYKVSPGDGLCPCKKCQGQSKSNGPWWIILIFTACHVVYDQREAQRTEVDFFYDSEQAVVTTLDGHDVEDNSEQDDVCIVHCISHDQDLVSKLKIAIDKYEILKWEVRESLMSTLCVVISHPHGKPKKVSIGEVIGIANYDPEESLLTEYMYTYTADTCNGSSGAPVLAAVTRKTLGSIGVWPGAGPHSGHIEGEVNQCGPGSFYVGADALDKTLIQDKMKKLKTATTITDLNFILIGKTGVGKSALGNAILGKQAFVTSAGVESATIKSEFAVSEISGKTIKVVDMPGVGDTRFSHEEGAKLFVQQLDEAISVSAAKFHIFLLVIALGTRFTQEDKDMIIFLKGMLGKDFVRHRCIIVMTYGDIFISMEENLSFMEWCQQQYGAFKELIQESNDRILLFNNKTRNQAEKTKQIEELLNAASLLQPQERRYTEFVFSQNMAAREKFFVQMQEPEISVKVLQEESIILQELRRKRSDTQALKFLFMRTENLLRYVKTEDRGSGALQHLIERLVALRKTVEESSRVQKNLSDWMTQTSVKEIMTEEEIRFQQDLLDHHLLQSSTADSRRRTRGKFLWFKRT